MMSRKFSMIAAGLLLCLPIGGVANVSFARCLAIPTIQAASNWWVGPAQMAMGCACLAVLSLTASLRWHSHS